MKTLSLSRLLSQLTSTTACSSDSEDYEEEETPQNCHFEKHKHHNLLCSPEFHRSNANFHSLKVTCLKSCTYYSL